MNNGISIIVPVFNVIDRLEKCLDSIIKQTYREIEIILVDDGSTDGSSELCDFLAEQDERISVFHKKNGGLSDARNFGLSKSQFDYVAFIDSDDVIHPLFCEYLMNLLKKYNADISCTRMLLYSSDDELVRFKNQNSNSELIFKGDNIIKEYLRGDGAGKIRHCICDKLFKKELFDDIRFDVGKKHEDVFIMHKLLSQANTFVSGDAIYYYYYQANSKSICAQYSDKNFCDEYEAVLNIQNTYMNMYPQETIEFSLKHYRSMMLRNIKYNSPIIKAEIKHIKKYCATNINKCNLLCLIDRLKILCGIHFPQFVNLFRNVKKEIKKISYRFKKKTHFETL